MPPTLPTEDTSPHDPSSETNPQRFARELIEILNELRVALPGVQLLVGFMLVAPFNNRFTSLSQVERVAFFIAFIAAMVATALYIAPSVYHRLHWRREIEDKEAMLSTFTALAIAGSLFLSLALSAVTFLVTDFLYGQAVSIPVATGAALMFGGLWYALPLSRRAGAPKKVPIKPGISANSEPSTANLTEER